MTRSPRSRWLVAAAGVSSLALVMSGCSSDSEVAGDAGSAPATDCAAYEQYGDLAGKEVNVYASILSPELEMYEAAYVPFEECTGANIKFEGSAEFEAQLKVREKAGNPPDIALIPQPGLLANQVATGSVKKPSATTEANIDANWQPIWKDYGSVDGEFYAAPNSSNLKSLVWYSPSMFADNGWTIPATWDELKALTDTIVASGIVDKPWCAGFGSGDATGWPGTDWVEDVMLRLHGPEVYDQWVNHEIPFNDPKVAAALDEVGYFLKNESYVNGGYGGVETIASTTFQDGGLTILDGTCALHRQAQFYAGQWPEGTNIAEDGDVFAFYLPPADPATTPVLGGGEFITAYADRPEVVAAQEWLATADYANSLARNSTGLASANLNADATLFTGIAKVATDALVDPDAQFRFDGSDAMPAAVGAGSFWVGMTQWITGKSTQDTLDFIEKSWPKS
ncbi:MAG: ABC transporter substrate-binding protein [Candidatus Nanopelagicales bacterium]